VKKTDHGIVVIVIYVDDLIITGNSDVNISDLKKLLKQKFKMKDLGELRYFLDIEVCSWSGKSIHANTTKATFGCSEAHTKVHKTYLAV
jgi:hypothetical protein